MLEKLLENWLDSASELSYQAVFVQLLAAEGYTVLHSTRHCTLEYGKDILAIAPDGVGCAFQLKGDPRGRMSVDYFRKKIQHQIVQLMSQSPAYPGFPVGVHRAYLVSNGQYDEEVQVAVRQMNDLYPAKLVLWSRGHLFDMSKRYLTAIWPSELKDNRALLEIFLANANDQLPISLLAEMMVSLLSLDGDIEQLGKAELERAASSACLLTGIMISGFAEANNHQAVIHAWTLLCVSLIAATERHARGKVNAINSSLVLAESAIKDSLAALWEEVDERKHLVEGDALVDTEVYAWRIGVLYGLLTALAIADEMDNLLTKEQKDKLKRWLITGKHRPEIWSEATIAYLLPWMVWLRKNDATIRPDLEIYAATSAVINANQPESNRVLPNPYYSFQDIARHKLQLHGMTTSNELARETFEGSAFTAELLLHLLVRTNLKQHCKELWPNFTRIGHRRLCLSETWHYCVLRVRHGIDETRLYPSTYDWSQLKAESVNAVAQSMVPDELANRPWLLALWWLVAPHRLNSDASRVLANSLLPGWGT